MRIRLLLAACIALTAALVMLRLVVLNEHSQRATQLDRFQLSVERISRDAARLALLSQNFTLHPSPSASRRWRAVHEDLAQTLPVALQHAAELQPDIAALTQVALGLPLLFNAIEAATIASEGGNRLPRDGLLADHLIGETGRISDGAFELAEDLTELRRAHGLAVTRATALTMAAFSVLVLAIAAVVTLRVLRPMAGLQRAAQAVRSGDLAARSDYRAGDEFGSLSHSFDEMAKTLAERTGRLQAAERDLRNILDAVPSVIGYCDSRLSVRFANHACEAWFGLPPSSLEGLHMRDVMGDRYTTGLPLMQAALEGRPQTFERLIPLPDGSGHRNALGHYLPDVVEGEVRGFYVVMHDVTQQTQDQARLAAALRENEALLSTIRLHTICAVADRHGVITEAHDNFCQITGYSREELVGQDHRLVNSGVHSDAFWAEMWQTITAGKPWRGEICNRAKDGSLYWVDSIISPFMAADGTVEKYISIRSDITPLKQANQRLQASEAFLDRTGRVAGVGGWTVDIASGVVEWTDQTCRITERPPGYRPTLEEALSHYAPEARPVIEKAVNDGIAAGQGWDLELPFITATGRHIWVRAMGEIEYADGKPHRLVGAFQDVTARRALETALRQKNELMASILENLPCGLSVFDAELGLVASNREYRRLLAFPDALFSADKPRFENFIRFNAERGEYGEGDVEALVHRIVERARSPAVAHRFERTRLNGIPVEVQGAPMPGGGFVTTYTDVSERKRAEILLQQAHDRFSIAADSADIGVWEWDVVANTLIWDERMYRLYGRQASGEQEPYALWADNLHPDDRAHTEAALQAALAGTREYVLEFRIQWPDGEVRHLKANGRVQRDASGQPLRMTGVNIDITEHKRAEVALRATSSLLRTMLDSASEVSIIATDPRLNITAFNIGAERLLGYTSAEMVGRMTPIVIHDPDEVQARGRELSAELGREVEGGAVFTEPTVLQQPREWTYVRKDRSRVTVSLVVTAMQGEDGQVFGYLGIAHDVTRQKAYEASLRQAMHEARRASLAKSQFLANMSHEIRTPMNAVIGLSYLLGQTDLNAGQANSLAKLQLASKSLLSLINDILDLSKVEAGELTIEQAPFKLRHLLNDLGGAMQVHADAKHIHFHIDAPDNLPALLVGDATRLNQILTNLLANAIKFTESGSVTLQVQQLFAAGSGVTLCFAVKDSGIGIAPEVQARLFEPFAQGDASMTRRFGGTGLGLSIVRRLATLMDGQVGLTSTPGLGSEFTVVLPFALAAPDDLALAAGPLPAPGERVLEGVRVLVVDDSEINLEVARRILELEGANVTLASNGQQAIEKIAAEPTSFDAVLMDVQMPVLDGYEATRRIRDELGLRSLPILALTAGALTSERQRAAESGMNDFITKPFDPPALVRCLWRHLRPNQRRSARRPATGGPGRSDGNANQPIVSANWPEIAGIDAADACARLGGDIELFHLMLERLLEESVDIAPPGAAGDAAALPALASRMHKLRGGAGTLGAKTLQRLAHETEEACLAGALERAAALVPEVLEHLQTLSADAAAFLASPPPQAPEAPALQEAAADPQLLQSLAGLLRQQNLAALDHCNTAAGPLRRLMGAANYETLRSHVNNLRFGAAVTLLEQQLGQAP